MQWDRDKSKERQKEQEELLREYLVHHLYPYSPFYRRRLDAAGVTPRTVSGFADLAKIEPTSWAEVTADPASFVLRPTERAIARFGDRRLVMAITRAKIRGRVAQLNRDMIDPAFKPIHWHLVGPVPVGYSSEDVGRLAEAGRRVIQLAALSRDDVVVGVTPPGPELAYWQIVDGARLGGLSAIHLGPDASVEQIETAAPTVLAGPPEVLSETLEGLRAARRRLAGLRTLLALGTPLDTSARQSLEKLGRSVGEGDLAVVVAWAPPGVRALWSECRGGRGFHTYPDFEWLEVLPDGDEVAWSSLAWHGTTFLRLRIGVSGAIDDAPCETCGRVGPRLTLSTMPAAAPLPAPTRGAAPPARAELEPEPEEERVSNMVGVESLRVLDDHPGVAVWQAEYRRVDGQDELIVFVSPAGVDRLGPLFRDLDSTLHATQYVVLRPEQIRERVIRDGAVLDLR